MSWTSHSFLDSKQCLRKREYLMVVTHDNQYKCNLAHVTKKEKRKQTGIYVTLPYPYISAHLKLSLSSLPLSPSPLCLCSRV